MHYSLKPMAIYSALIKPRLERLLTKNCDDCSLLDSIGSWASLTSTARPRIEASASECGFNRSMQRAGVLCPKVFLGRSFNFFAIASN